MGAALAIDNPVLAHALDPCGHDLDVLSLQRRIVVIGDEDAAGSDRVIRNQGRLQLRVSDDAPHVLFGQALEEPAQPGACAKNQRVAQFETSPDPPPVELRQPWVAREAVDLPATVRPVGIRGSTQLTLRWNNGQVVPCLPGDCGTNWMALAAMPITATRFPRRSSSWFQLRRVEHRSVERLEPRDVRDFRPVQLATACSRTTSAISSPPAGRRAPRPSGPVVQVTEVTSVTEPEVRLDTVLLRTIGPSTRGSRVARRTCGSSRSSGRTRSCTGATARRRRRPG